MPRSMRGPKRLAGEAALQLGIKQALSFCGYSYLETGKPLTKFKCKKCGEEDWPEGTNNNDPGVPDLLVFRDAWPAGMMLGLEVKAPKGWKWSSVEQRDLAERARIVVVHGVRDALHYVQVWEASVLERPNPRITEWMKVNEGAKI